MVVGFDCYYQIVKCFCDEDLCVDCQLEFIQIDIEISFFDESDIIGIIEKMVCQLFKEVLDVEFDEFLYMLFEEVMCCYGLDKFDLCILLELVDVVDQLKEVEFKVFFGLVNDLKGCVVVLCVLGVVFMLCSQIDDYIKFVGIYGVKGLVYIKVNECVKGVEGLQLLIVKFIFEVNLNVIFDCVGVVDGDIVFFGVDKVKIVCDVLGVLCIKVGYDFKLFIWEWVFMWVVDFLMFEENDDGLLFVLYYLFILFKCILVEFEVNLGVVFFCVYDMVFNGIELGGGFICIYDKFMQQVVFCVLGIDEVEQEEKFGFLFDVFKYGVLLYGGLVFGLDCLVMLMIGVLFICEVIVFLKIQSVGDVMIQVLGFVDGKVLCELYICLCEQLKVE